jgi:hypothetical protein
MQGREDMVKDVFVREERVGDSLKLVFTVKDLETDAVLLQEDLHLDEHWKEVLPLRGL